MIVWGGCCTPITGGRYNPSTDSWTATSTTNVPSARFFQTAVWSGSEMIVWGGDDNTNFFNTGGKYNPGTDSWTATSTLNAPVGRQLHTAIWTGSEMIVWGGGDGMGNYLNTGGRYNPSTNSWTATSITNAPAARTQHTAVWSGSEMIVWGGDDATSNNTNTGGGYSPTGDSWMATNLGNAPSARDSHSSVWSGSEMIVWGGIEMGINHLNTGGRYCAATTTPHPAFFTGEIALGGGWYYLQFANGTPFGYYFYLSDPHFIYHLDMGFEYLFDANNADRGIFFYDFASSSFFYTSPSTFPYLYNFSLNAWLYYLPDASNPGRYSHNPRWFFNFATGQWINL
jgi:N-acetylneuraminic acid mutarotase